MEASTQHTPGPWKANAILGNKIVGDHTADKFDKIHINGTNTTVAACYRRADAALLAAAPDLLAIAVAMLRLIDGLPWHIRDAAYKAFNERTGGLPGTLPKPIVDARAAIAKANGC